MANFFTEKAGPIPVWGWLAGGTVIILFFVSKKQKSSGTTSAQQLAAQQQAAALTAAASGVPSYQFGGSQGYGNISGNNRRGHYSHSPAASTTPQPTTPSTTTTPSTAPAPNTGPSTAPAPTASSTGPVAPTAALVAQAVKTDTPLLSKVGPDTIWANITNTITPEEQASVAGNGGMLFTMPNVVGMSPSAARAAIMAAGAPPNSVGIDNGGWGDAAVTGQSLPAGWIDFPYDITSINLSTDGSPS